ncbi:ovochymase-1 [Phocoena phocoena]|uniref:ovochymase-1 n=1 Tax=Phocoena phocoena TaxID=9742 RepID=UPI003306C557
MLSHTGLKCGIRAVDLKSMETILESGFFSRVSRWGNSTVGGHLWQVSLKLGRHHFCGGSSIQDDLVVTAAHCLASLDEKQIKHLTVTAGEYNLFQKDKEEQKIPVSEIIIHPKYNRLGCVSFDIARLYLKHKANFDCKPQGTVLFGENGKIRYPHSKESNYSHNRLCIWKIMVPENKVILIKFTSLDIENQVECDHDYVSLQSSRGVLISKVCGNILPSPLLTETNEATVTFVSDTDNSGSSFELTFTAIRKNSEAGSGCGSGAVLVVEGIIHSAGYPHLYPRNVGCHWLIHAPEKHTIKLTYEDLSIEFNQNGTHAVVIYGDPEEEHGLAKLCEILNATRVFSPGNMMVIPFKSDGEKNFQRFKARFSVLPSGCLNHLGSKIKMQIPGPTPKDFDSVDVEWGPGTCALRSTSDDTKKLCPLDDQKRFQAPYMKNSLNKIGSTSSSKTNAVSSTKDIPYGVCGIPPFSPQWLSRRIAGGEEACPHCWPWQVGLRFLGNHQCGGTIISSIWILTAAHCVQSKNNPLLWTIVAGDHDRTLKEPTEQVRRAKHIVVHEDFDRLTFDSDIALIQLSSALEFNSVVRPVCLPHSTEPLFSSEICVVTGWGSVSEDGGLASRLQQIQVLVVEREVCERTYYSAHPGGITEKMICAGSAASGGKDVGQGDSGGPLVCKHEKAPFVLYGIVSWGASCPQPRKPGVFARVSVFLDWIQSRIKGPVLLQINKESKILTRQQLPPPTPSRDSASGPGCYSEVELEEPRGFFSSPRYPLDYRGKLECSWVLRVSPSSMAKFTVEYLSLPGSHVCGDSVLTIYEENHNERRMSGELCGRRLYPMIFMSSGPLVRVTFHSRVQGAFGINYIVFRVQGPKSSKTTKFPQSSNQEHVTTCDDVILTKPTGIIQIPRYFHRTTMSCHWRLLAPSNHIIRLDIVNFQMQPMPLACQGHLWVYEGFGSGKKLIGNYFPVKNYAIDFLSQNILRSDNVRNVVWRTQRRFASSSNYKSTKIINFGSLFFVTSSSVLSRHVLDCTYTLAKITFKLASPPTSSEQLPQSYGVVVLNSVKGKINGKEDKGGCPVLDLIPVSSIEITSPNYPNIYPNMLNCTWTFYSMSGNKMKAVIKGFITEESWNCEWDYFNIYDGPDQQSRLLDSESCLMLMSCEIVYVQQENTVQL